MSTIGTEANICDLMVNRAQMSSMPIFSTRTLALLSSLPAEDDHDWFLVLTRRTCDQFPHQISSISPAAVLWEGGGAKAFSFEFPRARYKIDIRHSILMSIIIARCLDRLLRNRPML